jgi:hypothetical protein
MLMLRGEVSQDAHAPIDRLIFGHRQNLTAAIAADCGVVIAESEPRAIGHGGSTENQKSNHSSSFRDFCAVLISGTDQHY